MTITFQSIPWGIIGMLLIAGIGLAHIIDECFNTKSDKDETIDKRKDI